MKLYGALRLEATPRLALVGAGGKSTALFQLARELIGATWQVTPTGQGASTTALVTATTHLGLEQARMADHHFVVSKPVQVDSLAEDLPQGVVLFTGAGTDDGRWSGVLPSVLQHIHALAKARQFALLVEADGSRMRPVKAPDAHEPPIPSFVDAVVVVAGLSALGKPLSTDWVHRPDIFASLAGVSTGAQITPQALMSVLAHPQGGLKNIPGRTRRLALLNQADTPELQAAARAMAGILLDAYQAVIIASLNPPSPSIPSVFAVHERVAGVILAAGEARRFGQPKPLLDWHGQPFLHHVIRAALAAGLSPLFVVSGAYTPQIRQACAGMKVELVHNPDWSEGQSASLRAGLRALPAGVGAVVFLLADQPQVPASVIAALLEAHAVDLPPLVAPLVDGQRANPVLFDRRIFPDLMALQGDVGGRALFAKYPITWVPWHDPGLLLDVDTPEDYQKLLDMDWGT